MKKEKIKKETFKIISDTLKVEVKNVSPQKTANDFEEWDSLSNVRLILNLEKFFKIKINTSEAFELKNINDLLKLILNKIKQKN
tara:strand:+ start:8162 stop:8413 length:252 start_codon:yes stop_codon:yes gene_type:complete